eukprot:scaffold282219_cov33-Tisochrysis_lutea.AAC.1
MWTVRGCPSRSFGVDVMPTGSMLIKNEHQSFSAIAMLALIASSEWLSMPELSAASKAAASVRPSLIGCRAASMRHALTAVPVEQADTSPCPARTSSYTNHRANSKSPSEIAASTAAALDDAPSAKARARISLARVPIAVETNPKRPPEATRMVSRDDSSVTVPTVRIANKRRKATPNFVVVGPPIIARCERILAPLIDVVDISTFAKQRHDSPPVRPGAAFTEVVPVDCVMASAVYLCVAGASLISRCVARKAAVTAKGVLPCEQSHLQSLCLRIPLPILRRIAALGSTVKHPVSNGWDADVHEDGRCHQVDASFSRVCRLFPATTKYGPVPSPSQPMRRQGPTAAVRHSLRRPSPSREDLMRAA